MRLRNRAARGLVGTIALVSLAGCTWLLEDPVQDAESPGKAAPASLFAHAWVWNDEGGAPVRFARWGGKPLVVATIFTTCRMTCPRTIQRMREVHAEFGREGRAAEFFLVTLDPATDTPAQLRRFKEKERLPAAWHLLAGTPPETRQLAEFLDVHVMDADSHIMHDGRIVVFDARGMAVRSFGGWGLDDEAAQP